MSAVCDRIPGYDSGDLRARLCAGAALLLAATALVTPSAAQAKTFKVGIDDVAGDGTSGDSRDMVGARVAYNRKTGAISMTVRMNAEIALDDRPTVVTAGISNVVNGKCGRLVMQIVGTTEDPTATAGMLVDAKGKPGKIRLGKGNVDGDVFNLRARHRSLAGKTPGCVFVGVFDPETEPFTLIDGTDPAIRLR